jgi:hypothetical protein
MNRQPAATSKLVGLAIVLGVWLPQHGGAQELTNSPFLVNSPLEQTYLNSGPNLNPQATFTLPQQFGIRGEELLVDFSTLRGPGTDLNVQSLSPLRSPAQSFTLQSNWPAGASAVRAPNFVLGRAQGGFPLPPPAGGVRRAAPGASYTPAPNNPYGAPAFKPSIVE